jgi:hypothetical protein
MKAVVIATDYVKDINGEFKVLELNTQTNILFRDATNYLDLDGLEQFVSDNGITNIELILPYRFGTQTIDVEWTETDSLDKSIDGAIRTQFNSSSVNVETHYTSKNSTTIPLIEDNDTTLIIRVSYDSTALIDSVYCTDNFEFLKLMYDADTNSIPKSYFVNDTLGIDSIGDTIRDNGNYPNFIVKERFPTTNYEQYPKVYKINTAEELSNLKSSLPSNTILQEYVFNPSDAFEGKLKTYRVISMVYGSNLDILDLTHPFEHTNGCAFSETVDFDTNGELAVWERPCYIQKYLPTISDTRFRYQFDDASKIFMPDGSISTVQNIQSGSILKSLNFDGMPLDELISGSQNWSSSFSELTNNMEVTTTTVVEYSSTNKNVWLINLELSNGSKFVDIEYAKLLSKIGTQTEYKFNRFYDVNIGDYLMIFNNETNTIQEVNVTNIEYSYETINIFSVDVEPIDVLLTSEEGVESPIYAIYQHNPPPMCMRVCCSSSWPVYSYQQCPSSGGGWCNYNWPSTYDVCVEGYYPSNCYSCVSACFGDGCSPAPK